MDDIKRIKELIKELNHHRDLYYNNSNPEISDYEYDNLFDELSNLEKETGIVLSNSPTVTVGYEVKSKLNKVKHSHPMLSLDKTKSVNDLMAFAKENDCILMDKLDGLTVLLTYEDGELVQAETRGNGEEGEIITHNAKVFKNIPTRIPYKDHFEIEGEAIIFKSDFENINAALSNDEKYKNPRNLAAGSVRQLDSSITSERNVSFIAWKVPTDGFPNSMLERFNIAKSYGFDIVPFFTYTNKSEYDKNHIDKMVEALKIDSDKKGIPIDGLVITYNDIEYGLSLGFTGHHPRHSLAFKYYEDEEVTTLKEIEWSVGKTGEITPVLLFDDVELCGTTVSRASAHNLSILNKLEIGIGDEITIYKANDIIPQCRESLTKSNTWKHFIPQCCPICKCLTEIRKDNDSMTLHCTNSNCSAQILGKLTHFASKNAINIEGLSESTIEKLINLGLINDFRDIYYLSEHKEDIKQIDGFGQKSVDKLIDSIENSRETTLSRFIYSLSIPLIGKTASKAISKYVIDEANKKDWGGFNRGDIIGYFLDAVCFEPKSYWISIEDFGDKMADSLYSYFQENYDNVGKLSNEFTFVDYNSNFNTTLNNNVNLNGQTFCITGSVNHFKNRDEFVKRVEECGGKYLSGVSAKLNYLVNNDKESTSGKNKKARDLGIPVISEDDFLKMIGE